MRLKDCRHIDKHILLDHFLDDEDLVLDFGKDYIRVQGEVDEDQLVRLTNVYLDAMIHNHNTDELADEVVSFLERKNPSVIMNLEMDADEDEREYNRQYHRANSWEDDYE